MISDRAKLAIGVVAALVLVGVLAVYSGFRVEDWRNIDPAFAALAVLASIGTVACRGFGYALYAPDNTIARGRWLDVGAQHQALFSLVPSGLGDLGFPVLANRHAGVSIATGAGIIGLARLRDILVLGAMFLAAMPFAAVGPWATLLPAAILLILALALEPALAALTGYVPKLAERLRAHSAPALWLRSKRTALAAASWLAASAAVWCAFRAAGSVLAPAEAVLLIGGLNAAGILAFTVGGLGIAELGAAAVLIWLGVTAEDATRTALTARPLLLCSVVLASALIMLFRRVSSRSF